MSVMPDTWIELMSTKHGMITPFEPNQVGLNAVSYGLSSYGYDVRLSPNGLKLYVGTSANLIDPKAIDKRLFADVESMYDGNDEYYIIPPHSFVLATTVEYIKMPRMAIGLMTVKSTHARCGLLSPPTVLEPEWQGEITIEIANSTPSPVKIYADEGIAQVLFFQSDVRCAKSYADKKGKYQGQTGVTLPKVQRKMKR